MEENVDPVEKKEEEKPEYNLTDRDLLFMAYGFLKALHARDRINPAFIKILEEHFLRTI